MTVLPGILSEQPRRGVMLDEVVHHTLSQDGTGSWAAADFDRCGEPDGLPGLVRPVQKPCCAADGADRKAANRQ